MVPNNSAAHYTVCQSLFAHSSQRRWFDDFPLRIFTTTMIQTTESVRHAQTWTTCSREGSNTAPRKRIIFTHDEFFDTRILMFFSGEACYWRETVYACHGRMGHVIRWYVMSATRAKRAMNCPWKLRGFLACEVYFSWESLMYEINTMMNDGWIEWSTIWKVSLTQRVLSLFFFWVSHVSIRARWVARSGERPISMVARSDIGWVYVRLLEM